MTTRTVAWALTWEYWRRGAIWLVPAVAGLMIACTGSLYGLILHVTRLHYSDLRAELDMGLLAFVILPPVVLTVASFAASRRYQVLPVPTALFVGCTLANGAVAAMLTSGLVALVLGRWLDADWPLLGPACWAATVYVVLQSLAWQAGRSRGLFIVVMGLFLGFVMPLAAEYWLPYLLPLDDRVVRSGPRVVSAMLLAMASAWVLAYFLAVSGVARDRRGEAWSLAWLARVARWPSGIRGAAHEKNRLTGSDGAGISFPASGAVLVRVARQGASRLAVLPGRSRRNLGLAGDRSTESTRHRRRLGWPGRHVHDVDSVCGPVSGQRRRPIRSESILCHAAPVGRRPGVGCPPERHRRRRQLQCRLAARRHRRSGRFSSSWGRVATNSAYLGQWPFFVGVHGCLSDP